VQHWYEQQARVEIDLYAGSARAGLDRFRIQMKALSRSFILRMRLHRSHARWLLGRLILGSTENRPACGDLLREVEQLARQLAAEDVGFARVWSLLLTAGVERQRGREEAAVRALEAAVTDADRHGLLHCQHAALYRLGERVQGERGADLKRRAISWAESQQIKDPARLLSSWGAGLG
jgi:hypothetical protein